MVNRLESSVREVAQSKNGQFNGNHVNGVNGNGKINGHATKMLPLQEVPSEIELILRAAEAEDKAEREREESPEDRLSSSILTQEDLSADPRAARYFGLAPEMHHRTSAVAQEVLNFMGDVRKSPLIREQTRDKREDKASYVETLRENGE